MPRSKRLSATNAGKIQLSRLDFLELEARHSSVRAEIIEGQQRVEAAQQAARERIESADKHRAELLRELAVKYNFDPNKTYKSCLKRSMLIQVDAQGNEV
jgi:hypothetical protein